jgi:hypothetical protein
MKQEALYFMKISQKLKDKVETYHFKKVMLPVWFQVAKYLPSAVFPFLW